jgi:hypothetical protein
MEFHPGEQALSDFGLPPQMQRRVAEQLSEKLSELWQAAHRRPPGALRPDLAAQHSYFDPVAQGRRLREAMLEIEPVDLPAGLVAGEMRLDVDGQRVLITPEGRIALALLNNALQAPGQEVQLNAELAWRQEHELLALYREWGRHRQRQVVDYLGGGTRPLQIPAIGAALTLLVNRADSPDRSIRRFEAQQRTARRTIDEAFFSCADAFAEVFAAPGGAPKRKTKEKEQLISGWTLHEITRRLPDALILTDTAVYVAPGHQSRLLDLLVAELRRRKKGSAGVLEDAFDALVTAFHKHAEALAGYGLLYERSSNTKRLREDLLRRWREGE